MRYVLRAAIEFCATQGPIGLGFAPHCGKILKFAPQSACLVLAWDAARMIKF
jgi:hypothetical protein